MEEVLLQHGVVPLQQAGLLGRPLAVPEPDLAPRAHARAALAGLAVSVAVEEVAFGGGGALCNGIVR